MRALVAAPGRPGGVELRDVDEPSPAPDETVVAVRAVSLNRGEVLGLARSADGARAGWDLSGEVVQPAANGRGPAAGIRVVGLVPGGAWAERVAVSTRLLAPIPDELDDARACTLPVAGLTATLTLHVGGLMTDHAVLVTGAAGGVGRFAVQLAAHAGADVTAVVGRPERGQGLREIGAAAISVGMPESGEFHIILESAGGSSLAAAFGLVAPGGTIVSFGNSSHEPTTFDVATFFPRSGARLYGFVLFPELQRLGSAARELGLLASLAATGRLDTQLGVQASWREPEAALQALVDRQVDGKAVLLVD